MAERAARTCLGFWERRRTLVAVGLLLVVLGVVAVGDGLARADVAASDTPAVGSELPALRTADSRTYVGPDGTLDAHVYADSVNYRDSSGAWQPDNNTLVSATDAGAPGFTNAANAFHVALPQTLGFAPVTVTSGQYSVSFSLDNASGYATTSGATATYAGALPGVDLSYTVGNTRLEEDLVLAGPSSPSEFTYSVSTSPGLTAQLGMDGSIQFVDASGRARLWFFAPNMADATGESGPASFSLASTSSGYEVTLKADASWLASPDRAWPVTIDPGAMGEFWDQSAYPTIDGYVANGTSANTNFFSGTLDTVGWDTDGSIERALMKFNTESILTQNGGKGQVLNAELKMYLSSRLTTTTAAVGVYDVTRSWTSSATWNKYDGTHTWTTAGGDRTTDPATSGLPWGQTNVSTTATWYTWNVTRLVEGWNDGTVPDNGLTVKNVSETTSQNVFFFKNARATSNLPYIAVTYYNRAGDFAADTYRSVPLTDSLSADINVGNGSLDLCQTDLSLPGTAGFGLTLNQCIDSTRAINFSQIDDYWYLTPGINTYLESVTASGDTGNGVGTLIYHGDSGDLQPFTPAASGGAYLGPTGFNATLATASGTLCGQTKVFVLTFLGDKSKRYFANGSSGTYELLATQDVNGNTICFAYGVNGLSTITDTQGRTITFHYQTIAPGDSRLSSITFPSANCPSGTCTYSYTYSGTFGSLLASFTDPTGAQTQFTYSAAGQLATITDPNGQTSNLTWTAVQGGYRVATIVDANSKTTTFTYGDTSGGFCSSGSTNITDPASSTPTRYCSDGGLRVTSTKAPDGTVSTTDYTNAHGGSGCTDTYGDSLAAAPCSTTDANGHTINYSFSNASYPQDLASLVDPVGTTTSLAYADSANPYYPTSVTDANGYATQSIYDSSGRLTCSQAGLTAGSPTGPFVCAVGNVSTDRFYCPAGKTCPTTTYGYDTKGDQVWARDPDGFTTQSIYDSNGLLTCSQSGLTAGSGSGVPTVCPVGNDSTQPFYCPATKTCPTTKYGYDAAGNQVSVTDPNGFTTQAIYDSDNRLTCSQTGLTAGTGSSFVCGVGTDSSKAFYCPTGKTCPTTSYRYDANGNQAAVTNPNGFTTQSIYDGDNQLTCSQSGLTAGSGGGVPTVCGVGNDSTQPYYCPATKTCPTTKYGYDSNGNQVSLTGPNGYATQSIYDPNGNLTCSQSGLTAGSGSGIPTVCPVANDSTQPLYCPATNPCPTTKYGYDQNGAQVSVTDPNGNATQSILDANGRLTCSQSGLTAGSGSGVPTVCPVGNDSTQPFYCPAGKTCPTTTYGHDANGNQVSVTDPNGRATQSIYDNNGQQTCSQSGLSAGSPTGPFVCAVGNVSTDRFYCPSGKMCPTTTYSADADGNQTAVTDPNGRTTQSIYDNTDHLTCSQSGLTSGSSSGSFVCAVASDSSKRFYCLSGQTCPTMTYSADADGNQTAVTDPNGRTTQSIYDNNDQLTCSQSGLSAGSSSGAFVCAVGNDSTRRFLCPSAQTCPSTTYVYDSAGNQVAVTDPGGYSTQSIFDNNNQLTCSQSGLTSGSSSGAFVCAVGNDSSKRFYCPASQMCATRTHAYDSAGNEVAVTAPDGYAMQSIFDNNNHRTCMQSGLTAGSPSGAFVCAVGNDSTRRFYCPSTQTCPSTTYVYDSAGNQVAITDPGGYSTQSIFDNTNQLTCSQSGLTSGSSSGAFVCAVGNDSNKRFYCPTTQTCPTTTHAYDSAGNEVAVTDPDGYAMQSIFDNNDQLTCSQSGLSAGSSSGAFVCAVGNDSSKRFYCPTTQTCPTTTYAYDANGNPVAVIDPDTHATQSIFDNNNQLTCSQSGLTSGSSSGAFVCAVGNDSSKQFYCPATKTCPSTTYAYDSAGNEVAVTDPDGYATQSIFDNNNQPTCSQSGLSAGSSSGAFVCAVGNDSTKRFFCPSTQTCPTSTHAYDSAGNEVAVTNPDGYATQSIFDNNNQLTCSQSGLTAGSSSGVFVCAVGNDSSKQFYCPPTQTCPTTTYAYDANGNKTTTTEPTTDTFTHGYDNNNRLATTSYSDATPTVSFTYTAYGNRLSMTDSAGTVNYLYDNTNQLLSSTRGSDSFTYGYDAAGNITSRSYPDGTAATYTYTNNERLGTVTSGGNITTYGYYPAGEVHTRTLPNGYVETSTYDNVGRRSEIENTKSGTVLSDYTYSFDAVGNPLTVVQSGAVSGTTLYQYNNNEQLVDACYQATTCSEASGSSDPYIHYSYDGNGNRLTEARPAGTTTSTYNNTDELTSAGSTNYTYDANGNQTGAGNQTFTYNAANQLTATTNGGTTTNYAYDGDGNQLSTSTSGTTTAELWDANGALPQLALERNSSNTTLRSYIYGNERISMNSGGAHYYLYDTQGSVANVTSATGTTDWTYAYDPFGTTRTQTHNDPNAPANPMQYSGQMLDQASGLYNLRARQYDTTTGRFLSQDPLADADQTAGTYIYANDNPNIYNDPAGTCYRGYGDGTVGPGEAKWDNRHVLDRSRLQLCKQVQAYVESCTKNTGIAVYKKDKSKYDPVKIAEQCWNKIDKKMGRHDPTLWLPDALPSVSLGDFLTAIGNYYVQRIKVIGSYAYHHPLNLINGQVYVDIAKYYYHHPVDAIFDLVSVLPGGAVAKGAKVAIDAAKGVKIGSEGVRALKVAHYAGEAFKGAEDVTRVCSKNSFPGDTPVAMADGSLERIREVKVGDKVLATDPMTGETSARPVVALMREHERRTMVEFGLSDGSSITATDLHPFWDASTGTFADAIDLPIGDQLLTVDGGYRTVTSAHSYERELKTYNLRIAGIHTYYAGTTPVLVHNRGGCKYLWDFLTSRTVNRSATYTSERDARAFARTKLGKNAVDIGDNKLRSVNGRWQYRAKPSDVADRHVHLERLDPLTGEVLENWHLRW